MAAEQYHFTLIEVLNTNMCISKLPFADCCLTRKKRAPAGDESAGQPTTPHVVDDLNDTEMSANHQGTIHTNPVFQKNAKDSETATAVPRIGEGSTNNTHSQSIRDSPPLNRALGDHRPHTSEQYSHENESSGAASEKTCINSSTSRRGSQCPDATSHQSQELHRSSSGQINIGPYMAHY